MYARGEARRPDEDRADTGAYCPIRSMVRESYDCIIGDARIRAIPLGRVAMVRGSLWRHAYTAMVEAMMNRRKSNAEPEGLSHLNLNAAGIDVGATSHFVAVLADRVEERGFQVMLVDPRRIKNVPGRKTDVLDCQWLQQLHTYGLLSGAFRPDRDIRRLRSYLRQRAMLVEYASQHIQHIQHIQHMQNALTQMNVKLQHVISDIAGRTGTEITWAIVGGQRDPVKLAQLRDPWIKVDEATIAKSLRGHWRAEHIFELTKALELYRAYVEGQRKCPPKCSAKMSLGYAAMVSDDGVVDAMRTCRVGGLSASRYLLTVARWIPNSRAIPRMDIPLRFAFCIACQRAFWRKVGFRGGMAALPALLPRLATGS